MKNDCLVASLALIPVSAGPPQAALDIARPRRDRDPGAWRRRRLSTPWMHP